MDKTRDEILACLRAHKDEMARLFGVRHLSLFGSAARGETRPSSDIDLLVDFDGPATAERYFGLQFYLEDRLGAAVDLVTEKALRKELRPFVERDAVRLA